MMYSTSHEDVARTFYLTDCQLMGLLLRRNSTPKVLFRESMSLAWSESLYPTKLSLSPR